MEAWKDSQLIFHSSALRICVTRNQNDPVIVSIQAGNERKCLKRRNETLEVAMTCFPRRFDQHPFNTA